MSATMTEPYARVSFAKTKAQANGQTPEVARALGRVQRLAEARSAAWLRRQPTGDLTARLEAAWADLRAARALLSADEPPKRHGAIRVSRGAHRGGDHPVDRFMQDRIACAPGLRVALSDLADELAEYVDDDQERDDLPSARQLARQLRARGLTVRQAGPRVWVEGVRLAGRDETAYMPDGNSNCQSDGEARSSERHETAGRTGEGGKK